MDRAGFWTIIDKTLRESRGDAEDQAGFIHESLLKLPEKDILSFDAIFSELALAAYRNDMHAAVSLVIDDCSVPGFVEFLGWLIARGKSVYETAVRNPDTLADIESLGDIALGSGFVYIAMQAWEDKTGNSSLDFPPTTEFPSDPTGPPWNVADTPVKLPKMWKRFRRA